MKKNVMSLLAVVLLSACGSDSETFEERSEHLAEALCTYGTQCGGESDYDDCYEDVVRDMKDAREAVGESGEDACMKCMKVMIEVIEQSSDNDCEELDEQRVSEECSIPGGNACAGYP
ncbi:hypothetical protein HPC49_13020 [Pyxidicoccus fallax]|uniref:Lipoprotein n=1 Tax=Pyxidicoccus fallax TaxID=394095 RepID=A0A848LLJ7_9BACT|nr:hypothetical protein [Pyxidicoccus fallax]NMO18616.1 hypothetical protein [Pyxidicoccus fallax]NPC79157.1 hypothetical protein [Pyxidicoccus fallax]